MAIPFTQYLLPNGRRAPVCIERAPQIESLAEQIIAQGFAFECEMLRTGEVRLTITDPAHGDADFEMSKNGPEVGNAVDRLVSRFSANSST